MFPKMLILRKAASNQMFLLPLIFIAITKIYTIPSNHVQTFFRKEIFLEILISFCDDQLGQQSLGC